MLEKYVMKKDAMQYRSDENLCVELFCDELEEIR